MLLVILLTSIIPNSLGNVSEQPSIQDTPTQDQPTWPLTELSLNKQVYTRGETLNITVKANVETVKVQIYDSEKLFLSYNQKANTSETFLLDEKWSFGYWNITAVFGNVPVFSSFTVLNDVDYLKTELPYSCVHLGTNYTITDYGINATTLSTNRSLLLFYPTINELSQKTVSAQSNNMSVRTSFVSGKDLFVVTYAFVHLGVEFTVNGTTEASNLFKFGVNGTGSQSSNCFRSGSMVFDWSDIESSGLPSSWNNETKTLSVNVDKSFLIDPYLYSDGFESGSLSQYSALAAYPAVVTAPENPAWKGTIQL